MSLRSRTLRLKAIRNLPQVPWTTPGRQASWVQTQLTTLLSWLCTGVLQPYVLISHSLPSLYSHQHTVTPFSTLMTTQPLQGTCNTLKKMHSQNKHLWAELKTMVKSKPQFTQ